MSLQLDAMMHTIKSDTANDALSGELQVDELETVQKIDTVALAKEAARKTEAAKTETALKLAEEAAKRNAESGSEKKEESDVSENPGITYERKIPRSDTKAQTVGRKSTKGPNAPLQIRDFPKSLIEMIKKSFGDTTLPNTKALQAFVYANRDQSIDIDYSDVPDDVIALARTFDNYKTQQTMDANLRKLLALVSRLSDVNDDISRGIAYLIYDRAGFNTVTPNRPSDIDFEAPGIEEVETQLEMTCDKIREQARIRAGVPIR